VSPRDELRPRDTEAAAIARLKRLGGDELVRELTALFLEDMPGRLQAARTALGRSDAPGVADAAHKMKSASAQLGAVALAQACERLEVIAESRELAEAPHLCSVISTEYESFSDWLSAQSASPPQPASPAVHQSSAVKSGRKSIAVVEDNADNRLLVDAILGDRFELHEYETGSDALDGMARHRPDLVLLDVSLPGMDGIEVVARLRSDAALADVPIVALTAHAMTGDRERYLAAGFDAYVAKPIVDENVLIDAIERLLRHGRRGGATRLS
jgi:CheY-like chemotaxis protein/HPt (histidine-containing phosphotransfer) domain-containing protein